MMRPAALPRPDAGLPALGTVRHFAAHETIFAEGEPAAHFMLVIHGMVRSCSLFADGRRFIGAFYAAGDLFGIEGDPAYFASAEAVCETAVVFYPAPDWVDAAPPPRIAGAMLRGSNQARGHARLLGRLRAIEKISSFLLERFECSRQGTRVELEMTRQDIGDYLGITVETVSRCLARLKREGLIGFRSARLVDILDVARLRAIGQ